MYREKFLPCMSYSTIFKTLPLKSFMAFVFVKRIFSRFFGEQDWHFDLSDYSIKITAIVLNIFFEKNWKWISWLETSLFQDISGDLVEFSFMHFIVNTLILNLNCLLCWVALDLEVQNFTLKQPWNLQNLVSASNFLLPSALARIIKLWNPILFLLADAIYCYGDKCIPKEHCTGTTKRKLHDLKFLEKLALSSVSKICQYTNENLGREAKVKLLSSKRRHALEF